MSLYDVTSWINGLFDSNEDRQTEYLRRIALAQGAQVDGGGESRLDGALTATFWSVLTVPRDGGVVGVPAGETTVDFEDGVLRHQEYRTDELDETFRSLDDVDTELSSLRSAAVYVDAPVDAQLNTGDRVRLRPGTTRLQAARFHTLTLYPERPLRVGVVGSTRALPPADAVDGDLRRLAALEAATPNGYSDGRLRWTTPETAEREGDGSRDYAAYADAVVPLAGRDATIVVKNTSDAANAFDVEVRGRLDGETWHQHMTATGLGQGDHHIFDVERDLAECDVRIDSSGAQVSAHATLYGGSNPWA